MKINKTRKINSIQLTAEERKFLAELWQVAENWTELGYNSFTENDIEKIIGNIVGFIMDCEDFDGTIEMVDII